MNLMRSLALALLLASGLPIRAEVLAPSRIEGDDVIKITLTSTGCFHHYTKLYELRSQKNGATLEVSTVRQKWDERQKRLLDLGIEKLGSVELTDSERQGLDALLVFYRHKYEGGCTTSDVIGVSYERAGKIIGSEKFTDATCLLDMAESLSKDEAFRGRLGRAYDWDLLKKIVSLQKIERRLPPRDSR